MTGGRGKVADYVGTYTGAMYSLPATGSASAVATATLTVSADGSVVWTRHEAATGDEVTLTLNGSGTSGPTRVQGSLSKRASGAVACLAVAEPPSVSDTARYYVLSGGSASVGAEPLTVAKPDSFVKAWAATYRGTWSDPAAGQSGALRLAYASSGRVKGAWTDADGTVRTVSGYLNETAEAARGGRTIVSGRLTLSAKGLAPRQVDVRLTFLADINVAPLPLVGTATDVESSGAYGLSVAPDL